MGVMRLSSEYGTSVRLVRHRLRHIACALHVKSSRTYCMIQCTLFLNCGDRYEDRWSHRRDFFQNSIKSQRGHWAALNRTQTPKSTCHFLCTLPHCATAVWSEFVGRGTVVHTAERTSVGIARQSILMTRHMSSWYSRRRLTCLVSANSQMSKIQAQAPRSFLSQCTFRGPVATGCLA